MERVSFLVEMEPRCGELMSSFGYFVSTKYGVRWRTNTKYELFSFLVEEKEEEKAVVTGHHPDC